jgi:hypothetical protein
MPPPYKGVPSGLVAIEKIDSFTGIPDKTAFLIL